MHAWQMREAKVRFYEVVKRAASEGPQEITLHARCVAVVLSREAFDRLTGCAGSFAEFMRRSPLYGLDELEFEHDRDCTRDVSL